MTSPAPARPASPALDWLDIINRSVSFGASVGLCFWLAGRAAAQQMNQRLPEWLRDEHPAQHVFVPVVCGVHVALLMLLVSAYSAHRPAIDDWWHALRWQHQALMCAALSAMLMHEAQLAFFHLSADLLPAGGELWSPWPVTAGAGLIVGVAAAPVQYLDQRIPASPIEVAPRP